VNLCHSNPCGHGGKCIRKEGGYTCVCKPGFAGDNCQLDMNLENCKDADKANVFCYSSSQCVNKLPGILCANCTGNGNFYTPLCQLRSRSFYRGSFLTFPALRQRYRLHLKLRLIIEILNMTGNKTFSYLFTVLRLENPMVY
jgi:EGF-like domain